MRKGGGRGNELKCIEELLRQIVCSQGEILNNQNRAESILCEISCKVDKVMAEIPAAQLALINEFKKWTSAISARIKRLEDLRDSGGMTAEQEELVMAEFRVIGGLLEAAGTDPNAPLPTIPPEPPIA